MLYNLHRIANHTRHVYLVEGALDCARFHHDHAGEAVVALLGRTISPEQVELLRLAGIRFTSVLLDGDAAGRQAAPKVAAMLAYGGLYSRILHLPDGTDPASVDSASLKALLHTPKSP